MNDKGREYIQTVSKQFSESSAGVKNAWNNMCRFKDEEEGHAPGWADSIVQERVSRLGREVRDFAISMDDFSELEAIALATLKEDLMKRTK